MSQEITAERKRLSQHSAGEADWKKWGPYLSERTWGTVREDYSTDGAAWRVCKIEAKRRGKSDRDFLERVFHKLLLNFTWWVNRKDIDGCNIFQGGFLGLDNISIFDRSAPLPADGHLDQSDGTAWMAFFCLSMLQIALELSREQPVYEDMAIKFFEHFLAIARAMTNRGGHGIPLWDEEDGFFYDALHRHDGSIQPLKVRSMVGLIPLLAVETLEPDLLELLPDFSRRLRWFIEHKAELADNVASMDAPGTGKRRLLAILDGPCVRIAPIIVKSVLLAYRRVLCALRRERAFQPGARS